MFFQGPVGRLLLNVLALTTLLVVAVLLWLGSRSFEWWMVILTYVVLSGFTLFFPLMRDHPKLFLPIFGVMLYLPASIFFTAMLLAD